MSENININDLEEGFYILGGESDYSPEGTVNPVNRRFPWWGWVILAIAVLTIIFLFFLQKGTTTKGEGEVQEISSVEESSDDIEAWFNNTDVSLPPCTIISDTLLDNIHLRIITPYNTVPKLHVGTLDTSDADIVFAALAADIGYDKGQIIGPFVCEGEPLSWGGGRKLGYCAIIDGNITLGVAENSPLFEEATESEGYFFRQYPAVDNGVMVENNPKNASFRRALCVLDGEVCIVATTDRVLMNDFSSTLVKLGVKNAIFLVGSTADGWYRTSDGKFCRLGSKIIKDSPNINYIVFCAE
ncbi:MAG: hypothetical protein IJR53_03010 [Bacteroidales bacterium]|nr:hypothetical protein [Bacteroidales bacterium]